MRNLNYIQFTINLIIHVINVIFEKKIVHEKDIL
jgi:hypothetical protein